jgi:hypothetical protein
MLPFWSERCRPFASCVRVSEDRIAAFRHSTTTVPRSMFIPHANAISPALSGVNSTVTGTLSGNSRRMFSDANTTAVAHVLSLGRATRRARLEARLRHGDTHILHLRAGQKRRPRGERGDTRPRLCSSSSNDSRLCSCYRSPLHDTLFASATGRPNRSYRMGTTTMFKAVELNKPNMMTMAIGA